MKTLPKHENLYINKKNQVLLTVFEGLAKVLQLEKMVSDSNYTSEIYTRLTI